MNKLVATTNNWSAVPELPASARTRSGVEFDPRADRWAYRDVTITVNLDFASWPATDSFVASAKLVLLTYAMNKSPSHLKNMHARLKHYLTTISAAQDGPVTDIDSTDLINYRASLTDKTSWYLGNLSGLVCTWHSLGYPGVTNDAVTLLQQLRIPGNRVGEAVLTHDPEYGPFTDIELQSIQTALDKSYALGGVELEYYLLAYLFMLLGQRSVQYAALKVRDFGVTYAQDGTPMYTLRIPRAKQRYQLTRTEFKDRIIIPQIGELLMRHCNQVKAAFHGLLPDIGDAPLFPARTRCASDPDGFRYHRTAPALRLAAQTFLDGLNVVSERTGQPLHIATTRFRRTVGTRAAIEGHGVLVIAELLDHTSIDNAWIYIEARPEIVERIDRALAMHLAPMAQAFAGMIIENESQATRADDPSSRVCDPRFDTSMKPMGNCGKHGFCGFAAPVACYTCVNFQPWLDGPHEAVLEYLLGERERLASQADLRIASVNDRTILAVAEVVRLCDLRRKGGVDG